MYLLALDEGTTSTRAVIFAEDGRTVASASTEFTQSFPQPGWVEHDAQEIWLTSSQVIGAALGRARLTKDDIRALGITNQRETTVVWDRQTGAPVGPAIVWQDGRGTDIAEELIEHTDEIRAITGLPVNTYFSAVKLMWMLREHDGLRARAEAGDLAFGTIDSWLIWNLTGGVHATDVTNASRTMLMDLRTGQWSDRMLELTGIPRAMLPEIKPSVGFFGEVSEGQLLRGTPITGVLGDQQAAAFGQCCYQPGDTKNTYGTGGFLLTNTGTDIPSSDSGLVSTVAYGREGSELTYALEGSIAVAGSLIQWLRDNLGLVRSSDEIEPLARSVSDNGDVYLVPAFAGLLAPHWRPDARGVLVGLTRFAGRGHIARAALESTAYQTAEVLDAMRADSGYDIREIRADGGMSLNNLLMQFQADLLGTPVIRSSTSESTALGAAFAAGLGCGLHSDLAELTQLWSADRTFEPERDRDWAQARMARWYQAVERSLGWV